MQDTIVQVGGEVKVRDRDTKGRWYKKKETSHEFTLPTYLYPDEHPTPSRNSHDNPSQNSLAPPRSIFIHDDLTTLGLTPEARRALTPSPKRPDVATSPFRPIVMKHLNGQKVMSNVARKSWHSE